MWAQKSEVEINKRKQESKKERNEIQEKQKEGNGKRKL